MELRVQRVQMGEDVEGELSQDVLRDVGEETGLDLRTHHRKSAGQTYRWRIIQCKVLLSRVIPWDSIINRKGNRQGLI